MRNAQTRSVRRCEHKKRFGRLPRGMSRPEQSLAPRKQTEQALGLVTRGASFKCLLIRRKRLSIPRGEDAVEGAEPTRRRKLLWSRRKRSKPLSVADGNPSPCLPIQAKAEAETSQSRARAKSKEGFCSPPPAVYPSPSVPLLFAQMTAETLRMGENRLEFLSQRGGGAACGTRSSHRRASARTHKRTDRHVHAHARTHKHAGGSEHQPGL